MQTKTILIGIFLFLIASGVFIWAYFNLNKPDQNQSGSALPSPKSSPQGRTDEVLQPDGTIIPPIPIDDPAIVSKGITYAFDGTIRELREVHEGLEIITDITTKGKPRFILTKNTPVLFFDLIDEKRASQQDLKPDQKVRIVVSYSLKFKRWNTFRVSIIVPDLEAATSSAQTR